MPPKAKITKNMVIDAGFDIVRKEGQDSLNVRKMAAELGCSTQPVMYHYKTVDELKADIYAVADAFHSEYIMRLDDNTTTPMLSLGLNYIRFAYEEKFLFRFLFQSDKFQNIGFKELLDGDGSAALLKPLIQQTGLTILQARAVFETLFLCVHGYASLLANNSMTFNEKHCSKLLTSTFESIVAHTMRGEENEKAF